MLEEGELQGGTPPADPINITLIRAAFNLCCAVTSKGQVFLWGKGLHGERIRQPKLSIVEPEGIKDIALGLSHGLYVTKTGTAKSWGCCTYGETGNAPLSADPDEPGSQPLGLDEGVGVARGAGGTRMEAPVRAAGRGGALEGDD